MGLDAVELVLRAEEAFDIRISDEEAEKVSTVNDFYELILSKKGNSFANRCLSSYVFYKIRKSLLKLTDLHREEITPSLSTEKIFPKDNLTILWMQLGKDMCKEMPSLVYVRPLESLVIYTLFTFTLIYTIYALIINNISPQIYLIPIALIIMFYLFVKRDSLPDGINTLGNLTKLILAHNIADYREEIESLSKQETYEVLKFIIADQFGINPEKIAPSSDFIDDLGMG